MFGVVNMFFEYLLDILVFILAGIVGIFCLVSLRELERRAEEEAEEETDSKKE